MRWWCAIVLAGCGFRGAALSDAEVPGQIDSTEDAATPDASSLDTDLIAWFKLEAGPPAYDEIAKLPIGTCLGSGEDTCPYTVPSLHGNAFAFDGNKNRIDASYGALLQPEILTVAFWINWNKFPSKNAYQCPVGKVAQPSNDNSWQLCIHNNNDTGYEWLFITKHEVTGNDSLLIPVVDLEPGAWHHLAIVWDGVNKRIYQDGALLISDPHGVNGKLVYTADPLTLGADVLSNGHNDVPLDGYLDDVRIYDRILSSAELAALSH